MKSASMKRPLFNRKLSFSFPQEKKWVKYSMAEEKQKPMYYDNFLCSKAEENKTHIESSH